MRLNSRAGWCVLLAWLPAWLLARGAEPDPFVAELREARIEPGRQGLEKFLDSLRWTPVREARVRALLADLGSDSFETREKATAELIALPYVPPALLEEAARKELETQKRVERILEDSRYAEYESRVFLVLRAIEGQRVKGLAPLVLELLPGWQEQHLVQAAVRAVAVSAERTDGKLLRDALARGRSGAVRAAAVAGLASAFGREAEAEVEGFLKDGEPRVVLAAATALLNQGNRKPLAVLVRLLDAEPDEVRQTAVTILGSVTGKQFDYASYDEPKRRTAGVTAWREWVSREGATAKLQLPVGARPLARGRVVVAVYGDNVVREIDLVTGKTLFEAAPGFTYPWGCHATPEGHRLAVDYSKDFVVEFDSRGKECWRQPVAGNPTGIQRLANGRTLIALAEPGKVIELDRAGKTVWEVNLQGRPTTAQRLANGNTLVNLQFSAKVVEINRRGEVVREVGAGLRTPHTAEQLANGNVLVCDMQGMVIEYNRAGKVVWSKDKINNPAQAQRLPNGNTLVSGGDGLMEFDPKGNVVRRFQLSRSRFFAY